MPRGVPVSTEGLTDEQKKEQQEQVAYAKFKRKVNFYRSCITNFAAEEDWDSVYSNAKKLAELTKPDETSENSPA